MILRYQCGQEIRKGDRVSYAGMAAEIEFVATEPGDPETDWFVEEYGGGIMISVYGHTFFPAAQIAEEEDLDFVSRSDTVRK